MTASRVAVVAGNYREYAAWCQENGHPLRGGPVFYATPDALEGMTGVEVIRTGTWQGRHDLAELEATLAIVNRVPAPGSAGHAPVIGYEQDDFLYAGRCGCGAGRYFLTGELALRWRDDHGGTP
jgi:hypothetical protein